MNLTGHQKQFIKKNYKVLAFNEIADQLGLKEKEVKKFIEKKYGEQKIIKILKKDDVKFQEEVKKNDLKNNLITLICLCMLVSVAYISSINNAFVSDDIDGIAKNPNLGNFTFILSNPRDFLNSLVYLIIFKINGLNPAGFRIYNIALHFFSTFILYLILKKLKIKNLVALATSSIFAVHPLLTEAVAWISGRPYTQYTFFLFLSFYFYLLSEKSKKIYIASITAFILGIISSEKAIAFPLILFSYEFINQTLIKNWKKLSGYFVILGIGALYFGSKIGERVASVERLSAGSAGQPVNLLTSVPVAISTYLQLLFYPDKLTLYHSEMTFTQEEFALRAITLIIVVFITIYSVIKKRKIIAFGLCLFLISLSPTLTPFGISWIVAERYVYFGSSGIFLIFSSVLYSVLQRFDLKKIFAPIVVLLLIIFIIKTNIRTSEWKNEDTLWTSTSQNSPSSQSTHNNMGDVYARRKDFVNAEKEFRKSLEINPRYADAWHNLALTFQHQGKIEEAIKTYEKALSINPDLWQSKENLAQIYFSQNNIAKTEKIIMELVKVRPQIPYYYTNLGIIAEQKNQIEEAKKYYQKALSLDPKNKDALTQMEKLEKKK